MRKLLFFLFFVVFQISTFSQDLIIKKDSTKILCNILQVDSLKIHYIIPSNNKFGFINQNEVLAYYLSKSIELDSVQMKKKNEFVSLELGAFAGRSLSNFDTYNLDQGSLYIGSAENSYNYKFDLTLHLNKYFGIKASYFFQKNDFIGINNSSEIKNFSKNSNIIDFKDEILITPWKMRGTMVGVVFMFPVIENLKIGVSGNIGFPLFTSPSYDYSFSFRMKNSSRTFNYNYNLESSQERKMAFSGSIFLKYNVKNRIHVNFETLFFSSSPEFYTKGEIDKPSYVNGNEVRFYSDVRTFNFTLGISYDLIINQIK